MNHGDYHCRKGCGCPLNEVGPVYACNHEKNRSVVTILIYVSSVYDLVLAIDSTCPMSTNRQRKPKAGKLKKQASTEEMTASVEEV